MKFFQHRLPIDSSSMTRWRRRIGEAGAEKLLQETIEAGLRLKLVKVSQLQRVNVDTTVQEKHARFPTDARLYQRARERLVKQAKAEGIALRQSYVRIGKRLLFQQSRYAHAKQFRRARRETRKLRTILGRVIRDIERKAPQPNDELASLLKLGWRLYRQQRTDKHKLYSIHAPEVECIAKGKARKRYEFGCKVSLAVTSRGGWLLAARACPGNPYDGHALKETLRQVEGVAGRAPAHVFVDMGYRGHDYDGPTQVHVDRRRRGRIPKGVWRWMKRRAAIHTHHRAPQERQAPGPQPPQGHPRRQAQRGAQRLGHELRHAPRRSALHRGSLVPNPGPASRNPPTPHPAATPLHAHLKRTSSATTRHTKTASPTDRGRSTQLKVFKTGLGSTASAKLPAGCLSRAALAPYPAPPCSASSTRTWTTFGFERLRSSRQRYLGVGVDKSARLSEHRGGVIGHWSPSSSARPARSASTPAQARR